MIAWARDVAWAAGAPVRLVLVWLIRGYQLSLGHAVAGRCRFHPTCSEYAARAIAGAGALRGVALGVWRVLRCSPLTAGGIDHPPKRTRHPLYDADIQPEEAPA